MQMREPTIQKFLLVIIVLFMLGGCASGKGFKLSVESGGFDAKDQLLESRNSFVSDDTKELPAISGDEYEQIADNYLRQGKLYLAYVHYEKSLQLKPYNIRVEYKKGLALLLGERNEEAIKQFDLVVEKDPKFDLAYEGKGRAYFQAKNYRKAEENFRKAVDLNYRLWRSYNYLGNIADFHKNFEQAILEYRSAISVKPDQGFIYNNLGVSCSMAGQNQAAVDAFNKAMELNFREPRVFNNLGLAYANLGLYEEALDAFRKGGNEAQAYNNMGCIYLDNARYPEAVKCFERAIALEPSYYARAAENLKKAKMLAAKQ
jgi:Flp pilus assembly protein TadD